MFKRLLAIVALTATAAVAAACNNGASPNPTLNLGTPSLGSPSASDMPIESPVTSP
jgi:hypothetical protein